MRFSGPKLANHFAFRNGRSTPPPPQAQTLPPPKTSCPPLHNHDLVSFFPFAHRAAAGSLRMEPAAAVGHECVEGTAKKDTHLDTKTIKIMTYNVWSRGIEMDLRMVGLGNLIQWHKPDLVCLQEVTPDIHESLETHCFLWEEYECSSSQEEDIRRQGYYCLLMSKLPVNSSGHTYWTKRKSGRGLYTVDVNIGGGINLVLATTHLEGRVVSYFRTWGCRNKLNKWEREDERWRKNRRRRAQAEACGRILPVHPNVIFCGDMNWYDELDGAFPLPDGFIDPWSVLKPGENGYTYDTEANAMLAAEAKSQAKFKSVKSKLQGRLDRFFCKLEDFKIDNIEIIGKDKCWIIHDTPLLPSDHFGLFLTIRLQSTGSATSS